MKIIILAGGTPPSKKLLTNKTSEYDVLIAADSGASCLHQHNITPDYIIGDLDSIDKNILDFFITKKVKIEKHPVDKNLTDAELALKKAIELGATKITFLGCTGGIRLDHTLGALGLLDRCLDLNINATMEDDFQIIFLINKPNVITPKQKSSFSLQAYGEKVFELSITGAKYALENYDLKTGDSLTLANEFQNKEISIDFKSGKLLLILY